MGVNQVDKAIITGSSGAVGIVLQSVLAEHHIEVVPWDREFVSITDAAEMELFLREERPDYIFHLATDSHPTGMPNESWLVNVNWTAELARLTRQMGMTLVFTSSVMVFSEQAVGPFTLDSNPDVTTGYGYEKWTAEQQVRKLNPQAVIARLGWQIGEMPGSNNMVDFLHREMSQKGVIQASQRWLPACSFLRDTAESLYRLAQMGRGLYLLDANTHWTFYDIATALNEKQGFPWQIVPSDDFVYDQRMIDRRPRIPALKERLPGLPDGRFP